jgi:hypothetical protein
MTQAPQISKNQTHYLLKAVNTPEKAVEPYLDILKAEVHRIFLENDVVAAWMLVGAYTDVADRRTVGEAILDYLKSKKLI